METQKVFLVGGGKEEARCREFFAKYNFDIVSSDSIEKALRESSALNCPVVYASGETGLYAKAKRWLTKSSVPDERVVKFSRLRSKRTERLIDALSLNSPEGPNEYVRHLLDEQLKSSAAARNILGAYQRKKIMAMIEEGQKTLGVYYPSRAYRANLGSEQMYERIRAQGYNVVFLFGVIRNDEYEKRPYSFYVGHDIVKHLDFIDMFIMPTLTPDLPQRSKKILFVHDIYDSPRGKAEAPRGGWDGKPKRVSPLIAELDYTFLPARSIMPKSNICPLIRKKPLCRIPGGYMKLDLNIRHFQSNKSAVDSLIYAPTVCGRGFKNYVSLPKHGGNIVGALLDNFPDYRIIFRPHPHTLETRYVAKIAKRFRDNERFSLDSNASFYMDNYSRSAAMVTDMSGTAFTYAFTTLRPVVFFSHNEDTVEEAFDRVKYFQDREEIGHIARSMDELVEKMSLVLEDKDRFSERIREFRDCEIFNAGKAEEYFADNFHHIAEGIKHADWQYVISAIEPFDDEATDTLDETISEPEEVKAVEDEPYLMMEGYKGFNIVRFADRYYALAQSEGEFDIGKMNRNEYSRCFAGESVNEVKRIIDDPTEQVVQANQDGKRLIQG